MTNLKYLDRMVRDQVSITKVKLEAKSRKLRTMTNYEINDWRVKNGILPKRLRKLMKGNLSILAKFPVEMKVAAQ